MYFNHTCIYLLRGHANDFGQILIFLILLFTMLKSNVFLFLYFDQPKFGCQSQNYNQDTELTTLCNVNKAVPCFCLHWFKIPVKKIFSADLSLFSFILSINKKFLALNKFI